MSNANTNANPIEITIKSKVTAEDLKNQVDELYGHFNKLAESLNITKVTEKKSDLKIGKNYQVNVSFFHFLLFGMLTANNYYAC